MSFIRTSTKPGFTIIELLIIAPIAILVIAGLASLMINLVGDALIAQQRNSATYEIQDGLDQVEQDIRLATAVLQTTGALSSPQGSDQGTAAFTATNGTLDGNTSGPALMLRAYATTTSPLDASRSLVYTNQPSSTCTTPTSNDPLSYMIVYYVKGDPDNGNAMSLWRRTIVPTSTTLCSGIPWQKNSCFPDTSNALCVSNDRMVISNISSVVLTYYFETTNPYSVTTQNALTDIADNPTSVRVTANTAKTMGNGTVTSSMSTYASRINN